MCQLHTSLRLSETKYITCCFNITMPHQCYSAPNVQIHHWAHGSKQVFTRVDPLYRLMWCDIYSFDCTFFFICRAFLRSTAGTDQRWANFLHWCSHDCSFPQSGVVSHGYFCCRRRATSVPESFLEVTTFSYVSPLTHWETSFQSFLLLEKCFA